jgi:nicotinamidase-related amidase
MKLSKPALMAAMVLGLAFVVAGCEEKTQEHHGPGTALILIDLQRDYLLPDGKLPIAQDQREPLVKAVNALIAAAQERAFPVMYTMNQFSQFAILNNMAHGFAAIRYSAGQTLAPDVNQVAGPYFTKTSDDAFCNSEFVSHLAGLDSGNLVVAGVYADRSVLATVRSAIERGYTVTVISDAVGASSDAARDAALDQLKQAGAKVETSSEFLTSLGPVGAPEAGKS